MISLHKIMYIHRIYMVLANPTNTLLCHMGMISALHVHSTYLGLARTLYMYTVYVQYFWQGNHQMYAMYGVVCIYGSAGPTRTCVIMHNESSPAARFAQGAVGVDLYHHTRSLHALSVSLFSSTGAWACGRWASEVRSQSKRMRCRLAGVPEADGGCRILRKGRSAGGAEKEWTILRRCLLAGGAEEGGEWRSLRRCKEKCHQELGEARDGMAIAVTEQQPGGTGTWGGRWKKLLLGWAQATAAASRTGILKKVKCSLKGRLLSRMSSSCGSGFSNGNF